MLVVALAFWYRPQAPPPSIPPAPATMVSPVAATSAVALITVHVSGAVSRPGLVSLVEGSRVADALAKAGGALAGGALSGINLAAPVADGMQIVVPWVSDGSTGSPRASGESSDLPVDLNRAGIERLTSLPGVGEVLASRIVAHRETHGPFSSMKDLLDVPGIGEGKLAGLRDYAAVGR